jgi:monoamine oxidase
MHGVRRSLPSKAGFSRRDFLKTSLGAAASAALASAARAGVVGCRSDGRRATTTTAPTTGPTTRPAGEGLRVVVVGAGFAGLACADTLVRSGADVRVFEATGRPGGRVMTDRKFIPQRTVELGGEFIGTIHPTWIRYANRFGIQLAPALDYEGDEPILLDGRLIRGEQADLLYEEIDDILAKLIELAQPIDSLRPWRSPDAARIDRTSYGRFLAEQQVSADARKLLWTIAESDNGVSPDRMSMLAYLAMIAGGGFKNYFEASETHRALGGNDTLARALANSLGQQRMWFNSPALSIRRTRAHAVVHAGRGNPFECDAVVLAIPPSVWHRIAFENPMGERVPQMGKNVKLITKVRTPVWEQRELSPELIADGLVQLTWVSAENAPGLPEAFTLFSGGAQAEALRQLPARDRTRRAIESLRPAYPNLADAVMADRFIDWPGFTYALASYSFPAPGEVLRYGPILVDGVNDGLSPLLFAGEHTSYGFIGYMEGALSSGVRVAERILSTARQSAARRPQVNAVANVEST